MPMEPVFSDTDISSDAPLTAADWTLLVIAASGTRALEPVQLQKALFLVGRKLRPEQLRVERFYSFAPYDYGPFSRQVYDDAERLEREGLVVIERPPVTRFNRYRATEAGTQRALALRAALAPPALVYLDSVVRWTLSLSFTELVTAIYREFPEMRENSVFQD